MDGRFYKGTGLNIEQITAQFERSCVAQGYQVQHFGQQGQIVIQMREGGDLEALIGLQAALTLTLQSGPAGVTVMIGHQQWIEKAAVGVLGMLFLWPLTLTAGVGVIRQVHLEGLALSMLDTVVMQQRADVHIEPLPRQEGAFEQPAPPPSPQPERPIFYGSPARKVCANCHAVNDDDDSYCSTCGKPLAEQKKRCLQCNAELKPGAAFCPKCGTSVAGQV